MQGGPYAGEHGGPPANEPEEPPLPPPPQCHCGVDSNRLLSRSERNPNRWFYKCAKFRDDPSQCKFFVWEDELPSVKSPMRGGGGGGGGSGAPPPAIRRRTEYDNAPPSYGGGGGGGAYNNTDAGGLAYARILGSNTQPHTQPAAAGGGGGGNDINGDDYNGYRQQPAHPSSVAAAAPPIATAPRDKSTDQCFHCGGYGHW